MPYYNILTKMTAFILPYLSKLIWGLQIFFSLSTNISGLILLLFLLSQTISMPSEQSLCHQVLGVHAARPFSSSLTDGTAERNSLEQAAWQFPWIRHVKCFKGEVAYFCMFMMSVEASICHPISFFFYLFPFALSFSIFLSWMNYLLFYVRPILV